MIGFSQDEGLSAVDWGQYGRPECEDSEHSGGGHGVIGFSQDEGLSALGRGQYGWPECEDSDHPESGHGVVGFSQVEGLSVLGRGPVWVSRMRGIPSILGADRGGRLFAG